MEPALAKRAKEALHDYIVYRRDKGDTSESKPEPKRPRKTYGRPWIREPMGINARTAESAVRRWELEMLKVWAQQGRLREDGTLRVSPDPTPPHTWAEVRAALPWLKTYDALAALIELNGVVEEEFMDAHKNIREVVEKIADERIELARSQDHDDKPIREIIREEVGAVFGELLALVSGTSRPTLQSAHARAGKQRKCSKCGGAGHTRPTCVASGPAAPDKWACVHCTNLKGGSLTEPLTHPVPPEQFHQGDPSFRPDREAVTAA